VTPIALEVTAEASESAMIRESQLSSPSETPMNDSKIIAMRSVAHLAPDTPQMNAADPPAFEGSGVSIVRGLNHISVVDGSDDQVIRSLSSALEAAEQGHDRHCAEALRVAIAVRFAGLRAAERTAATETSGRAIRALQKWRLKRVVEYVDIHLSNKITLLDLAAVAGLSRMHFASQFRMATGLRPHEFLLRRRVRHAEELLRNSRMAIVEIALTVGFQTQAHFTTVFKRFVGCTPHQWRTSGQLPSLAVEGHNVQADIASAI
jgi:AraC-like DNA-binding protein